VVGERLRIIGVGERRGKGERDEASPLGSYGLGKGKAFSFFFSALAGKGRRKEWRIICRKLTTLPE